MSLFRKLQNLCTSDRFQIEDLHTEIVARVLRNSPGLTLAWLRKIRAVRLDGDPDSIQIETQERFEKLKDHNSGSRLDMTIRLVANGQLELIFVESKLPSKQGKDQLQKYAELLEKAHAKTPLAGASLVFITRAYEPADDPKLSDPAFKFRFITTRWHLFYQTLKDHSNGDGLAKELKLFMEENRMSTGNRFRSTDIIALENYASVKALMLEALNGKVAHAIEGMFGRVSSEKDAMAQLRDYNRLIYYCDLKAVSVLVGFYLPDQNPDTPVWVGVEIEAISYEESRNSVVAAFREWLKKHSEDWESAELDTVKAPSRICKGKPIHAFLSAKDHVHEIEDYLLGLLKEVAAFRKDFPKLPWTQTTD